MAAVLCWRAPGAGCTASPKVWLGQTRNFGVSLWYTCATALILLTRKTTARFQVAFRTGAHLRRIPRAAGACCPMHEPCLCVRAYGGSQYFFRSTSLNTLFISQVFTEVPGHRDAQVRSVCWFRGTPTHPINHSYHHLHADTQNPCPSCRRMRTFIMVLFSTPFWPEISTQRCIR